MTEPMPMPPPDKTPEAAPIRAKSKGEKFFDRAVYAGIAGVGTFIVTVGLTHSLKYGRLKWAHEGLAEFIESIAKRIAPNRDHKDLAEGAAMTTNLMMGGNLMLIPVGIAEKHKVALVDGLNASMDDPTPKETIQHAPKQTWMSLTKSRALAWVAVFAVFEGLGRYFNKSMQTFKHESGVLFAKAAGKYDKHVVIENGEKIFKGLEEKSYRYGTIAALDIFATIGSATLLYLGGHFFARRHEQKIEKREEHKQAKLEPMRGDVIRDHRANELDAPNLKITGAKQHDGVARESELAQQI